MIKKLWHKKIAKLETENKEMRLFCKQKAEDIRNLTARLKVKQAVSPESALSNLKSGVKELMKGELCPDGKSYQNWCNFHGISSKDVHIPAKKVLEIIREMEGKHG